MQPSEITLSELALAEHEERVNLLQSLLVQSTDDQHNTCFSVEDGECLAELSLEALRLLNQPESMQALRSDSFRVTDIVHMNDVFIEALVQPECLNALFCEFTTIDLLKELTAAELQAANVSGDYPMYAAQYSVGMS